MAAGYIPVTLVPDDLLRSLPTPLCHLSNRIRRMCKITYVVSYRFRYEDEPVTYAGCNGPPSAIARRVSHQQKKSKTKQCSAVALYRLAWRNYQRRRNYSRHKNRKHCALFAYAKRVKETRKDCFSRTATFKTMLLSLAQNDTVHSCIIIRRMEREKRYLPLPKYLYLYT